MSVHTRGKLIRTNRTKTSNGTVTRVCHVKENKRLFKTCQEYYWYMIAEWDRHKAASPCGVASQPVIFDAHDREILERMCYGSSYPTDEDTVYVDDWAVNDEFIFHRHPEFGMVSRFPDGYGESEIEFSTKDGKCDLCHTQVPGELEFLYRMYQL